jgi:hypothetical protein
MRRVVVSLTIALVATACGSDEAVTTTSSTTTSPATATTSSTTTTSTTTTTTTEPPPPTPFSDGASFALQGGPEEWSKQFVDPGAVVFHDGEWHMFYNGIERWPAHVKVGYATSPDGIRWTKQSPEPVFMTSDIPYAGVSAFMSDAEVLDDGTWAMWFYTVDSANSFATGEIGRLTAPGPLGPWVADPEPAVVAGPEGSWDSDGAVQPSVLRVGDEWWMWFDGNMGDLESVGDRSIGLATSSDGVTWVKYDDPDTTEAPFDGSDPVLVTDAGEWDERRVYDPGVERAGEGFVMAYFTRRPGTSAPEYDAGLAFSEDGITWEKDARNPFFRSASFGFAGVYLSTLIRTDAAYLLLFDAQSSPGSGTTVWYRLHEGSLDLLR